MTQQKIDFNFGNVSIIVPACVQRREKGKIVNCYLNLNQFSNWHYIKRNDVKNIFTKLIHDETKRIPTISKIHSLKYTLIRTTNQKRDRMNVYTIVDKFLCDALQEYGVIEDDSDEFIGDFKFTKTEYVKGAAKDIRARVDIYYEK